MFRAYGYADHLGMYCIKHVVQRVAENTSFAQLNKVHRVTATLLCNWYARPCRPMHSLWQCPTSNVQEESLHEHDHVHENVLPLGNRKVHSLAPEMHRRQYVTAHKSQCWKCGRDLEERVEQFFCECGVVLPVNECLNYFDVMGVSMTFELDPATLRGIFRNLQKDLHPDKFSKQSKVYKNIFTVQVRHVFARN